LPESEYSQVCSLHAVDELLSTDQSEPRMAHRTGQKAKLLVAYFSHTGNTKRVAQALSARLRRSCDVEAVEIIPTRKRSYLHWLAYSFVPDSEVEIENPEMDLSPYDMVLLGFPKWTFSCPPLNSFVRKIRNVTGPKFCLFMTSGGFDERRFLQAVGHKLTKMGCNIVECLMVRRKQIQSEMYSASVDSFAKRVEEHLH